MLCSCVLLIDAIWPAFIAGKRCGTLGRGPFVARLDAMAGLSHRVAAVIALCNALPLPT